MESKAILFHSNIEEKCVGFLKGDVDLICSTNKYDDIWLGTGMYFWDNKGNAKWWRTCQSKKHPGKCFKVLRVNADISKILDLTDYDISEKLGELWEKYCLIIGEDSDVGLGYKLNTLFSAISDFSEKYNVIKVYGR